MKTIFKLRSIMLRFATAVLIPLLLVVPATAQTADRTTALRRIAGILDYIGSDYAGAVDAEGNVVNELEYREQFSLCGDALALARDAGLPADDPVVEGLESLAPLLERRAPPEEVLAHCRAIKRTMIEEHDLVLAPPTAPDPARARGLYFASGCNACHGDDGGADTEQARTLDPPPADFLDPERMAGVSPHRAYSAITFGVRGTGMTGYEELSDEDRWSLAFWVLSLRHRESNPSEGQRLLEQKGDPVDTDATALSQMTDDELRAALEGVMDPDEVEQAIAYLRTTAPFEVSALEGDFALARERLREGVDAYRSGDAGEARSLFISAYLDGFEPQEPGLRARDADLVVEIEEAMLALREAAGAGAPAAEIERRAAEVSRLLDRAEGSEASVATSFAGSAVISLREGFEAVLLIAALLAVVRRRGTPGQARWVHAGWIAAVPAGALTWLLAGRILGGLERELAEGIIALAAAVVLLCVTHWIVGQATARGFMQAVSKGLERAAGSRGTRWGVFALAFIAVYREAFEVVLFYKALLLEAAGHGWVVLVGAATGLVVLGVLALGLKRLGQRLKPRPFMLASSVVLAFLSLMMLGKGIRALQEAGVVSATRVTLPDLPAIGLFGTAQGLAAQGVLLVLLAASALVPWLGGHRNDPKASPAE